MDEDARNALIAAVWAAMDSGAEASAVWDCFEQAIDVWSPEGD